MAGMSKIDSPAIADWLLVIIFEDGIFGNAQVGGGPHFAAIFGDMGHAAANSGNGRFIADFFSTHFNAAGAWSEASDDLGQLALAVTGHAGKAQNFATAHFEGY